MDDLGEPRMKTRILSQGRWGFRVEMVLDFV